MTKFDAKKAAARAYGQMFPTGSKRATIRREMLAEHMREVYRQGAEEMRERAAKVATNAYYDCPAEYDVDVFVKKAIMAIPIERIEAEGTGG